MITGTLTSLQEFHDLEQFAARGLVEMVPQYTISDDLLDTILADINERMGSGSGAQVTLVRSGRSVIAAADDPGHASVQKIITRYALILPSFDRDRSGNPYPESQIKVTMHLVESTEDRATEAGQKFSGAHYPLTGQIGTSGLEQAPFQYQLRYLSSHLATKLLEQPTVLAQSGTTAELHSGGDLAYQASASEHGVATQFRNYGLLAKVTPRTQHDGDIKLDLDLEISDPTGSDTDATNQTLNRRRVKSAVILQDGMSKLVARVRRHKKEQSSSGLPVLSDIPVVSWIVSSRGRSAKLQELWIFVSASSDLYQPFSDSTENIDDFMSER
jgi:Flp pilus assembly secretin CpaC